MMTIRISAIAIAAIALAGTAGAQTPVHWTATPIVKSGKSHVKAVKLSATIDQGWHIYSISQAPGGPNRTKISVADSQAFALAGAIKASAPDVSFDKNFGIQVETYENKADFTLPVKAVKGMAADPQTFTVSAFYQACNASSCLPPRTDKVPVDLSAKTNK